MNDRIHSNKKLNRDKLLAAVLYISGYLVYTAQSDQILNGTPTHLPMILCSVATLLTIKVALSGRY